MLTLHITTNGGSQAFYETATLKILPLTVHFNHNSLANILSLSDVANLPGARLTMDLSVDRAIILHFKGKKFHFRECSDGLYYLDICHGHKMVEGESQEVDSQDNSSNDIVTPYLSDFTSQFLQTVAENSKFYTKKEIKGVRDARTLQALIGWPSTPAFSAIIASNSIRNCTVTLDDIKRAQHIFGTPVPLLQGKMMRGRPNKPNLQRVPIPAQIKEWHRVLDLFIDFFTSTVSQSYTPNPPA